MDTNINFDNYQHEQSYGSLPIHGLTNLDMIIEPQISPIKRPYGEIEQGDEVNQSPFPHISRSLEIVKFTNQTSKTPRLVIDKLLLENFKSYGGKRVIGPFHKHFSAILGPNGSGKSNIIDAMLFVFGKRAKKLRLNTLSELIHDSSSIEKTYKSFARVTVYMHDIIDNENSRGYEIVPGSGLTISREVNSNGQSKYILNGKDSTYQAITKHLKKKGIDLDHNRFLILQGEVEQIALMKPKGYKADEEGFLEYLEDIIGTNKYIPEIEQAYNKYDELERVYQENYNRWLSIREILIKLESKYSDAKLLTSIEMDTILTQYCLERLSFDEMNQELDKLKIKLNDIENLEIEVAAELSNLRNENNEFTKSFETEKEKEDNLIQQMNKLDKAFKELDIKDVEARNELTHIMEMAQTKNQQISEAEKLKVLKRTLAEEQENDYKLALKQLPQAKELFETSQTSLKNLKSKYSEELRSRNDALTQAEKNVLPTQQQHDQLKKELSQLYNELELIKSIESRKEQENERLEQLFTNYEKIIRDTQFTLSQLTQENEICQQQKSTTSQQLESTLSEIYTISEQLDKLQTEQTTMNIQNDDVNSLSNAYKFIINTVKEGGLAPIHGRICEIGKIDPKYELAWSAVAGFASEFVLVDLPSHASKIFYLLRQKGLGRITCISLETLETNESRALHDLDNKPIDSHINCYRLINLIQTISPRYRICFYHLVKDTLVTENPKDAEYLCQKEHARVVTYDGVVFEADGRTTAGGNRNNSRGKLGSKQVNGPKFFENDIKEIQNSIHKLNDKLRICQTKKENLEGIKIGFSKKLLEIDRNISIENQNKENAIDQLKEISKRLKKNKDQPIFVQDETNAVSNLEEKIKELQRRLDFISRDLNNKIAEASRLRNALEDTGGEEMKRAVNKFNTSREDLEVIQEKLKKLKISSQFCISDSEKLERDLLRLQRENEIFVEDCIRCRKEIMEFEFEGALIQENREKLSNEIKHQKMLTEKLHKSTEKRLNDIEAIELKRIDLQNSQSSHIQSKANMEQILSGHITSMSTLKSKLGKLPDIEALPDTDILKLSIEELKQNHFSFNSSQVDIPIIEHRMNPMERQTYIENIYNDETLTHDRKHLEQKLNENLKKIDANLSYFSTISQFIKKHNDYKEMIMSTLVALEDKNKVKETYIQITNKRKEEFMGAFHSISSKVKEIYQIIAQDGDAELELVDNTDPFAEGISFSVRPPRKSWKLIQHLSGGEKTLSSLALIFALHHYKPTPVYFMDEIDAALDFKNVTIIANYIKTLQEESKNAQFIVISLRSQMFETFDHMIGIFKTQEISKSISFNLPSFNCSK